MTKLNLPSSTIKRIVDDPTLLNSVNSSSNALDGLDITPSMASHILSGYNSGFRAVFIMNATLAAIATVVSVFMIRHKNLTRDDEAQLRAQAKKEYEGDRKEAIDGRNDIEMGTLHENNEGEIDSKA